METRKKMSSSDRQNFIVEKLKQVNGPITGSEFARLTNVSRQVIVQDISLLKAKNIPILATNQGYILLKEKNQSNKYQTIIKCMHTANQTEDELNIIVDNGVMVKDVSIKHAVYGKISAPIMVSNRVEVEQFMKKIEASKAGYLLNLTDGYHFHTLEADKKEKIDAACIELEKAGILMKN